MKRINIITLTMALAIYSAFIATAWNMVAPAAWCWLPRHIAGPLAAATGFLLHLAASELKKAETATKTPASRPVVNDSQMPRTPIATPLHGVASTQSETQED